MSYKTRGWCFTLNNYTEVERDAILSISCKYIIVGREVGENLTPHLQGYIYFTNAKTLSQVKMVNGKAHFEAAKGTAAQNFDYCSKDGNFEERGEKPLSQAEKGQKGKEKLTEQWELAKKGEFFELPPAQIKVWEYIHMKYGAKCNDRDVLSNTWIFGPSGSGKSRYVREKYSSFYSKPMSKWWDGYANEDTIVLDDFAPEHGKYLGYFLKIWADHYAFNAEVKGGMLHIRPLNIVITSQYPIHRCFEEPETVSAITRRFSVLEMGREAMGNLDFSGRKIDEEVCENCSA